MRDALNAAVGLTLSVRFHGSPRLAPSVPHRGAGIIAFRTWGNMYVSVSPPRVLTAGEFDRLLEAVRPWDAGRGMLMALDEEATP